MSINITPNLFITTSFDLMNQKFYGINKSFKSIIGELSEEEKKSVLIASQGVTKNLLYFEHSYGMSGENKCDMILEFVDIDGSLNIFLQSFSFYPLLLKKFYDYANLNKDKLDRQDLESLVYGDPNTSATPEVYFAYGTSDRIDEWSGPYVSTIANITQSFTSEGVRSVRLEFTTAPASFFLNYKKAKEENTISEKIDRFSRLYMNGISPEVTVSKTISLAKVNVAEDLLSKDFGLNKTIVSAIKDYLERVTGSSNIVVILPDFSILLKNYIIEKGSTILADTFDSGSQAAITGHGLEVYRINLMKSFLQDLSFYKNYFKPVPNAFMLSPFVENRVEKNDAETNTEITFSIISNEKETQEYYQNKYKVHTDFYIPLKKLQDGIRLVHSSAPNNLKLYEETDSRILGILKKYNIIKDESKSAIVFGDLELIDQLIYLSTSIPATDEQKVKELILDINQNSEISDFVSSEDRNIFNNAYRLDFYNTFYKNFPKSYYSKNTITKEELQFIDLEDTEQIRSLPVFRCNVPNSNVVGFKSEQDTNALWAQNSSFKLKTDAFISTSLRDLEREVIQRQFSPSYWELFKDNIFIASHMGDVKNADDRQNMYEFLVGQINKTPKEYLNNSLTSEEIGKLLIKLLYLGSISGKAPSYRISDKDGALLSSYQRDLLNYIYSYVNDVSIKTVPMFHLGNLAIRRLMVLFILGRTNIVGSKDYSTSLLGYSGRYYIYGFKHVISNDTMYSEFWLNKNQFRNFEGPQEPLVQEIIPPKETREIFIPKIKDDILILDKTDLDVKRYLKGMK